MNAVTMMQRYEMKFILTKDQLVAFQNALKGHMEVDQYGKTSIASIYYDTPDYLLIRKSLENDQNGSRGKSLRAESFFPVDIQSN